MDMLSCLEAVRDALLTVTDEVGHYKAWDKPTNKYIVWAEDMEVAAMNTDNYKGGQTIEGTIDYFTKDEDDENIEKIQLALNAARIGWELNSVQYEDETRFIHYEWLFRVRHVYGDNQDDGS